MPEGDFSNDPRDLVVFGQGIGEIGQSQEFIIGKLADLLGRRVIGYESRLAAQTQDTTRDTVEVARSTHLRVMERITNERYSIVGHSLFGLTAGALLEREQGQVSDMMLIAPATVASEAIVSEEWRVKMREMTLEERVAHFKEFEKHWRRHAIALTLGFGVVNLTAEALKGVTNPIRSMKAGKDLMTDLLPGIKNAFDAFALLANVSTVPELEKAQQDGTFVQVLAGGKDPVFTKRKLQKGLDPQIGVYSIASGRGSGHSNMSTMSGETQLATAAWLINNSERDRSKQRKLDQ
jgi:hypothetical protein